MDFMIAMTFINWVIAYMMLVGFGLVKSAEHFSKDPNSEDRLKMGADVIINEYNSRSWAGRVAFVLVWGAKVLAQGFTIKRRD